MSNVWEHALSAITNNISHRGMCRLGSRCVKCSRLGREAQQALIGAVALTKIRPKVILVIGAQNEITMKTSYELTLAGNIALTRVAFRDDAVEGEEHIFDGMYGRQMDQLNAVRVELCDALFVVNPEGTQLTEAMTREITLAQSLGKELIWFRTPENFNLRPACGVCAHGMSLDTDLDGKEGWRSIVWKWTCVKCNPPEAEKPKIVIAKG